MRKLHKTETLVTIGDITYVREVTKLTCIVVCVYISSLIQFGYFLSLFEQVSLLSKQFNAFMCLPNVLLLRGGRRSLHILHTLLFITFIG